MWDGRLTKCRVSRAGRLFDGVQRNNAHQVEEVATMLNSPEESSLIVFRNCDHENGAR